MDDTIRVHERVGRSYPTDREKLYGPNPPPFFSTNSSHFREIRFNSIQKDGRNSDYVQWCAISTQVLQLDAVGLRTE